MNIFSSSQQWQRLSLSIGICLSFCMALFAADADNTGTVKGKVVTADNQPAAFVTVQLKGTKKVTATHEDGQFVIRNIEAGTYEIVVSLIGFTQVSQSITIEKGKTTTVNLQLTATVGQLQEVVVTAGAANKFAQKQSDYVARMPLENLENPQVYSVITKDLMQEQVVSSFADALKNVPGASNVVEGVGSGGVGINIRLRGFDPGNGVSMRNGIATNFVSPVDPVNLERIEILKGPSGTLFGGTLIAYGGLANRVTKQPLKLFKGEVGYSSGNFDLSRITLDLNTPLNKDSSLLFRINAAGHRESSFQDYGNQRNWIVAPSLTYQLNDRLTFHLDAEIYHTNRTSSFYGVGANMNAKKFNDLNALDFKRSFTTNDLKTNINIVNIFGRMDYALSSHWTSQTNFSYSSNDNNANYLFLTFINDSAVQRRPMNIPGNFETIEVQQNFIGDYNLGNIRNRLLLGLDFYHVSTTDRRLAVVYDTVKFNQPDADISVEKYDQLLANGKRTLYNRDISTYSAYGADVINFTDRLMAMLSLRVDHYSDKINDYNQTAWSPKLGLVYQVVKDQVALFGNYMNGFTNVAPGADPTDKSRIDFKPEHANQWEGGVKLNIWDGKVTGTLSYYDIKVSDKVRTIILSDNTTASVQDGVQNSKGFEAEIIANPLPGLNIVGGYGYNDSKYTKAAANVEGRRPYATPLNTANAWVSYKIMRGSINGMGMGLGVNYESDSYLNDANTFIVPAYTVFDASLFYDRPKYRIGVKVNNLTNKEYWVSNFWAQPQKTRQVIASVSIKF